MYSCFCIRPGNMFELACFVGFGMRLLAATASWFHRSLLCYPTDGACFANLIDSFSWFLHWPAPLLLTVLEPCFLLGLRYYPALWFPRSSHACLLAACSSLPPSWLRRVRLSCLPWPFLCLLTAFLLAGCPCPTSWFSCGWGAHLPVAFARSANPAVSVAPWLAPLG